MRISNKCVNRRLSLLLLLDLLLLLLYLLLLLLTHDPISSIVFRLNYAKKSSKSSALGLGIS